MHANIIKFELGCRTCKSKQDGMSMLTSENSFIDMDRLTLIRECNNFSKVQCQNCGMIGNWLVFKVHLDGNDGIQSQLKVNIIKNGGQIKINREGGNYSPLQLDFAYMKVLEELDTYKGSWFTPRKNGTAIIMVDFLKTPSTRVTIIDIDGMSLESVIEVIHELKTNDLG